MRIFLFSLALLSATAWPKPAQLGPVQQADTLWKLATLARPDEDVAMVQVVYALWQANPQAFDQLNINVLRSGSLLTVPNRTQMLATPVAIARPWFNQAITVKPGRVGYSLAPVVTNAPQTQAAVPASAQPTSTPDSHNGAAPVAAAKSYTSVAVDPQPAPVQTVEQGSWLHAINQDYTLTLQQRYYPRRGEQGQARLHSAIALGAEWAWQSDDRVHLLALEPYLRWDQRDSERNLADLRQAYWQYVGTGFDLKLGIDIVFWGVTESQHLVDVINQTDLVASIDGEAKLGQPMLNWNLYGDGGTLALYLLPYFRERTFSGTEGRLRPPLAIAIDDPLYESAQAERNLDFAVRWSRQFGATDLALSYFEGNNREPELVLNTRGQLQPLYLQMQQLGLEAQMIQGSWIWKLESLYRKTRRQDFSALTFGFEYTQVGLFDTDWDLGWIAEYQYDSRDQFAPVPGQNDLFMGGRLVANDVAGSEILFGIAQDLDNSDSRSGKLEASMRLSNNLRLRLDAWFFSSRLPGEPLYFIRQDDYMQLSLDYYF
jgi:FimV-like protein